jgi:cyclase
MREIAPSVYLEDGFFSGNVGCVTTGEGAVLIDSPMLPADAWAWLKSVASVTKQGISFLINTDYGIERVLGNCFFPTTGTIAHQAAWAEMQRYDEGYLQRYLTRHRQRYGGIDAGLAKARIVLPELTLTSEMTLYKGSRVFRIIYAGGHTPASIIVHLPKERILFAGNVVVTGQHPAMDQSNTLSWLHALEMIRNMEGVDVIVPGYGDPCEPSASRREVVDKVKMQGFFHPPDDDRAATERRIRASVERVYDEFKKGAKRRR